MSSGYERYINKLLLLLLLLLLSYLSVKKHGISLLAVRVLGIYWLSVKRHLHCLHL